MITTNCVGQNKFKLEGYEWVEGRWKSEDPAGQTFVNVTPHYFQIVSEMWDDDMNLNNAEKKDFDIKIVSNEYFGDIKAIVEKNSDADPRIYLDEREKALYWIYDFDQKKYLTNGKSEMREKETKRPDRPVDKKKIILGSWTDGEHLITFTDKTVKVYQGEYLVDEGTYHLDGYDDHSDYVTVDWKYDRYVDGDCLVVGEDGVSIEAGYDLVKIPKQADIEGGISNIIALFTESSKPYDGNLEWVYGLWKVPESKAEIYVAPTYYQARGAKDSYLDGKMITELDKVPYTVSIDENSLVGTIVRLGDYYLDTVSKLMYSMSGLGKRKYLQKTE